jgi:hypothetical protein
MKKTLPLPWCPLVCRVLCAIQIKDQEILHTNWYTRNHALKGQTLNKLNILVHGASFPIISNQMCKSLDIKITGVDGRTVPGTKMPATSFKEPKSLISFVCHPNPHSSTPSLSHLQIWWPSRPKMWADWPNFLGNTTLSLSDKSFSISWVHGLYCQEEIKLHVLLHILKRFWPACSTTTTWIKEWEQGKEVEMERPWHWLTSKKESLSCDACRITTLSTSCL